MTGRTTCRTAFAIITGVALTGCMPKMTIEDLKAMTPKRPPELDRLNAFAGKWEWTGEAKMASLDEVLKTSGENEATWEGNGWYLVSRGVFRMDDLDEMKAIETWTYDAHSKKYRSTWTDSMGTVGTGTATYDEKTNTWDMKATSHGPFGKMTMGGKVRFLNENTMEWDWTEYGMWGLIKTMEMNGTSKRK